MGTIKLKKFWGTTNGYRAVLCPLTKSEDAEKNGYQWINQISDLPSQKRDVIATQSV